MKTNYILAKVSFLKGLLDPNTVDGNPGQPGPIYSVAMADLTVAELLQHIAQNLKEQDIARKVRQIASELATTASQHVASAMDDDDICPPYFHHIPRPHGVGPTPDPWLELETDPHPWLGKLTPAMNDLVLGVALRELASLTTSEKASAAIRQAGETLVKGLASSIFDDYCGTPVKPRPPIGMKTVAV